MRPLIVALSLLLSLSPSGFASDDHYAHVMNFLAFRHQETIEKTYEKNEESLRDKIVELSGELIDQKWKLLRGLGHKVNIDIGPVNVAENIFGLLTPATKGSDVKQVEGRDKDLMRGLLEPLNAKQLKAYLASLHFEILLSDIIYFALKEAPEEIFNGADYTPIFTQDMPVEFLQIVTICYFDLFKAYFPTSYSRYLPKGSKEPLSTFAHYFKGYDSPVGNQTITWGATVQALWGKLTGRTNQASMSLRQRLLNPRVRLMNFVSSPDFQAVIDDRHETRISMWSYGKVITQICRSLCFNGPRLEGFDVLFATPRTQPAPLPKKDPLEDDLRVQIFNQLTEIECLEKDKKELKLRITALEDELKKAQEKQAVLTQKAKQSQTEKVRLGSELEKAQAKLGESVIPTLEAQLAELTQREKHSRQEIIALQARLETQQEEMNRKQILLDHETSKNSKRADPKIAQDLKTARTTIGDLEAKLKNAHVQIAEKNQELLRAQGEVLRLKAEAQKVNRSLAHKESQSPKVDLVLEEQKQRVSTLEVKLAQTQKALNELQTKLEENEIYMNQQDMNVEDLEEVVAMTAGQVDLLAEVCSGLETLRLQDYEREVRLAQENAWLLGELRTKSWALDQAMTVQQLINKNDDKPIELIVSGETKFVTIDELVEYARQGVYHSEILRREQGQAPEVHHQKYE